MLTYFIDPLEGTRVLRSDGRWAINFADDANGYSHAKQVCDELNSRETLDDILEVPQGSNRDQIALEFAKIILNGTDEFNPTVVSEQAYEMADAMIAESAKQTGEKSGNS